MAFLKDLMPLSAGVKDLVREMSSQPFQPSAECPIRDPQFAGKLGLGYGPALSEGHMRSSEVAHWVPAVRIMTNVFVLQFSTRRVVDGNREGCSGRRTQLRD
jgi:hypothetical protein